MRPKQFPGPNEDVRIVSGSPTCVSLPSSPKDKKMPYITANPAIRCCSVSLGAEPLSTGCKVPLIIDHLLSVESTHKETYDGLRNQADNHRHFWAQDIYCTVSLSCHREVIPLTDNKGPNESPKVK